MTPFKNEIQSQFVEAIQPFHLDSNLIDPKMLDHPLEEHLKEKAEQWPMGFSE